MKLQELNTDFTQAMRALGISDNSPVWAGIKRAVGVGPGEAFTVADFPIYAYTIAATPTQEAPTVPLLIFLATPGRFIRYEWTQEAAMTTTFPIEKVCSVEELEQKDRYQVSVGIDWHTSLARGLWEQNMQDNGVTVGRSELKTEGLTYIVATDSNGALQLAEFSRRLRLLVGV